ncbi:bifunctional diaminohydroxyphosphoribosylaminopyrimidine deaminase/5-amino-6-(5-phosphoribosylamino)uracil reductase RibD [Minwuia thermotolerans]|nr:bifunctional diaminohydroxyphosphoribosylaminopyrimidine deaminase/5-amino-6-(5-phosphoribosylamino)uracil reductase RibD [Minwuia thermotolerans]
MASATKSTTEADRRHMAHALMLARRGLGQVAPNPAVGCVLVADGRVIGRGWTQPGGRPHAETEALARAGVAARGSTAYVTLEPCSHHGVTPPCAEALAAAGVARVVIAMTDPDERVNGRGVEMLRDAGVEVVTGVLSDQAAALNRGFVLQRTANRPMVTLKLATTLDGRIATGAKDAKWITAGAARQRGHLLRASHDAILIGAGTALADDPELTCRLPGLAQRSPVRVVLDSRLSIPPSGRLVDTAAQTPLYVFCGMEADPARAAALEARGARLFRFDVSASGVPAPGDVLRSLAEAGITRLLIEGGARVAAAFVAADLVDELAWFRAATLIGGDGLPAIGGFGLEKLADVPRFRRAAIAHFGDDVLETYLREP